MSQGWPFNRPLVLGHRGSSKRAPENTLPAFRQALEDGANGIELDVHLCQDGEIVVMHDSRVNRTTNGRGRLASLKLEEIRRLDAGSWFSSAFAGTKVPVLAEVFSAFGSQIVYDIELKNLGKPGPGLEEQVIRLVRAFGLEQQVLFTSFNPAAVKKCQALLPEAPAGLLMLGGLPGKIEERLAAKKGGPAVLGSAMRSLAQRGEAWRTRDFLVWGLETATEVRQAVGLGASALVVDDPAMACEALRRA